MFRFLLLTLSIIVNACSSGKIKEDKLEIEIDIPASYNYNLNKQVYRVFFLSKPPLEINFSLTNDEWNEIIKKYYELELDEFKGETTIEDECQIMPKFYTILNVKRVSGLQQIKIDEDCVNFYISNYVRANKVKKFLKFVFAILQSKKEIKNAPKSDILYI